MIRSGCQAMNSHCTSNSLTLSVSSSTVASVHCSQSGTVCIVEGKEIMNRLCRRFPAHYRCITAVQLLFCFASHGESLTSCWAALYVDDQTCLNLKWIARWNPPRRLPHKVPVRRRVRILLKRPTRLMIHPIHCLLKKITLAFTLNLTS